MLQIRVHDDDRVAARVIEPGGDGDLLAEVAAERDGAIARIKLMGSAQPLKRAVAGAVVDENDLEGIGRTLQNRRQRLHEKVKIVRLVEHGDDDRKFGPSVRVSGGGRPRGLDCLVHAASVALARRVMCLLTYAEHYPACKAGGQRGGESAG